MIYIENNLTNPFYSFALEYYLIYEKKLPDKQIFMFWRTEPTLMIGRYQNTLEEINEKFVKENHIHVVRRITGGGTIYTDMGGWQFSFISKGKADQINFIEYIKPIIDALKKMGVNAEFNSRNDLVIENKKFSGNAQCMRNGYTLHHGSLLFNTSLEQMVKCLTVDDYKIISKGIKSVKERVTNISDHLPQPVDTMKFKEFMVNSIMSSNDNEYKLTDEDKDRINIIAKEKFENWQWNYGKSPKFNITRTGRFNGGKVEFKLNVNKGIIESCTLYGDFFGNIDVEKFCRILTGLEYSRENIKKVLQKQDMSQFFYNISLEELISVIC